MQVGSGQGSWVATSGAVESFQIGGVRGIPQIIVPTSAHGFIVHKHFLAEGALVLFHFWCTHLDLRAKGFGKVHIFLVHLVGGWWWRGNDLKPAWCTLEERAWCRWFEHREIGSAQMEECGLQV